MKSEVKFKVRSLNFAKPVGKFTSDFIRGKKNVLPYDNFDDYVTRSRGLFVIQVECD